MQITAELVKDLIAAQFPQWSGLPVRPVEKSGHDNRTFHLGDAMSVRLPSGKAYEAQVQKESRWLPYLQAQLDFPVSAPLAVGQPSAQYQTAGLRAAHCSRSRPRTARRWPPHWPPR